ncbi:MAG: serine hydrolase [Flavobacteriaceae bacterium]|nr:serine hydrolase [Flavobacteriaceae bacterium]
MKISTTVKIFISLIAICLFACKNEHHKSLEIVDSASLHRQFAQRADSMIQNYIDLDIFSGIVLVAKEGNMLYHKAFGLADRSTSRPNELTTLFDIGSMNKTFTSVVVKQLIAEGKLRFDDLLTDHIKGFKDADARKITIRHLLNHESGFGDYHTPDYFDLPRSERTLDAIVQRSKSSELLFEPGEEQEYSNLGYVILGAIIEKVSDNKSYFENVKERILTPLNLKHTYLHHFVGLDSVIAKGYYFSPLGQLKESAPIQDLPNPDGGFLSTTEDIMRFYRSYYNDTLLVSASMKSKDEVFKYLNELPSGKATGAFGGFDGFNTALYQILSEDVTIIVFANMDEPVAELIALDLLRIHRGETTNNPQLPAIQNVRINFEKHGSQYIKEHFEELITNFHPTDPKDIILNMLGYAYLYEANNPLKAIEIFQLNTQLFPDVANCWDSYGEGLLRNKQTAEAISAYEKALQLNPDSESTKNILEKLRN